MVIALLEYINLLAKENISIKSVIHPLILGKGFPWKPMKPSKSATAVSIMPA